MNIYVIAAVAVMWALSVVGAFYKGEAVKENEMMAQHAVELKGQISEHNENAAIDMGVAAELAAKRAFAQGRADGRKAALDELGRTAPPAAGCRTPAPVRSLLNDAINDANNRAVSADGVPGSVPAAPAPAVGLRIGPPAVGARIDQASGRVPGTAR